VNTFLTRIYGKDFFPSNYSTTLTSIAFAGTIVGMLTFGWLSDKFGRKFGMVGKSFKLYLSRDNKLQIWTHFLDDCYWNSFRILGAVCRFQRRAR
jgi:MFS family permease